MRQKNKLRGPMVVGIVDSLPAAKLAAGLRARDLDLLEWRADCMPRTARLPASKLPWIVTARDPREGGARKLSAKERESLFMGLLGGAAYVDIELRSLRGLGDVRREAEAARTGIILSHHDFSRTPPAARLREMARRAAGEGADVFKVATRTESADDARRLLELFSGSSVPVAVMGMGPLGFASRLLFAACGSVFNYGWLHQPNVPGQWAAIELKKMLALMQARPRG